MLDGAIDATTRLYRNDVARAAFVSHGDTSVAGYDDETGDELKTCLEDAADSISRGATLPVGWGTPISVRVAARVAAGRHRHRAGRADLIRRPQACNELSALASGGLGPVNGMDPNNDNNEEEIGGDTGTPARARNARWGEPCGVDRRCLRRDRRSPHRT